MTRRPIAIVLLLLLGGLLVLDLRGSDPLNPFSAPPLLAYGSGAPATRAHCASLPTGD